MKKLISVLLISMTVSLAFAIQVGRFDFAAYYNGRNKEERWLELNIFDGTSSTSNAGIIELANPEIGTEQSQDFNQVVFKWEVIGNYYSKLSINFNILPLQAYKNGIYYIPAHKFDIYATETIFENLDHSLDGVNLKDNLYANYKIDGQYQAQGKGLAVFDQKVSNNYPYPSPYNAKGKDVVLAGAILKGNTTLSVEDTYGDTIWTRRGECILTITDHDEETLGEFDYVANITVTTWVD